MNLIKHVLIVLLLDAGAVLAFGDKQTPPPASLALCSSPASSALYSAVETDSTFMRTPMEPVHEN